MKANIKHLPQKEGTKRKDKAVKKSKMPDVRHILVHCTATQPNVPMHDLNNLPYHYVITKVGKVLRFKALTRKSNCIDVAYLGGLDKQGKYSDSRTPAQSDSLFSVLVQLTEFFPDAKISGAGEHAIYDYPNPGFDIKSWLNNYIPEFLQAA